MIKIRLLIIKILTLIRNVINVLIFSHLKVISKGISNSLECHLCHKILFDSSSKSKHL
jgi:hypothetical protein